MHDMPAMDAWVGTAGFAQLGIAAGIVREGRERSEGAGFVAGLATGGVVPGLVRRRRSVEDCWVWDWMELADGFGAGGGAIGGTYCGVPPR